MPGNKPGTAHRIERVDALRGVAALLVVISHALELWLASPRADTDIQVGLHNVFQRYISFGLTGVVAFFLISGFVVPFSFRGNKPLKGFLIGRIFRLYPAYWFSLAIAISSIYITSNNKEILSSIIANLTMIQSLFRRPDIVGVYWTLFIEILFYIIVFNSFMINILYKPYYQAAIVLGLLLISVAGSLLRNSHPSSNIPSLHFLYLAIMHMGLLIRLAYYEKDDKARRVVPIIMFILIILTFFDYALQPHRVVGYSWIGNVNSVILAFVALFVFLQNDFVVNRTSLFFGKISYSMYLLHSILLTAVAGLFSKTLEWPIYGLALIGAGCAAIPISALAYNWVERPGVRFGKTLDRLILAEPVISEPI